MKIRDIDEFEEQRGEELDSAHIELMCGGREFTNATWVRTALEALRECGARKGVAVTVLAGAARGADQLAATLASEMGLNVIELEADWDRFGRSAGFRRNADMVRLLEIHRAGGGTVGVTAFPGGRGTEHTKSIAAQAGIRVTEVK
jgi:hypothetical protein